MKLIKKGKRNKGFYDLIPSTTGFFYNGKFYEGFEDEYKIDVKKISNSLYHKIKTIKAFKRWLRVNPYNAPKGTEFLLINKCSTQYIRGII